MWGKEISNLKVLGGYNWIEDFGDQIYVICAIGKSETRKNIYERLSTFPNVKLATLIDPTVRVDDTVNIGIGSIICYNSTVTVDVKIGKGVLLNTGASIGHDAQIGDYCTFFTNSMSAGSAYIGEGCEIGSGAFILQGKKIVAGTIIAPLTSVITDINEVGTYCGNPARRMR